MKKISFCISTYNRSEKIYKLVKDILKYDGDDIEVVVSDNCSTDDTIIKLSEIKDERFRYFVNSPNIGAIPNYIKAMSEGIGEYIFFTTDKDSIDSDGIPDLINFFNYNPYIIGGYSKIDVLEKAEPKIFNSGVDGLLNLAYLSQHPTGYFFKNEQLLKLNILKNYTDFDKVGVFPFEFLMADLCVRGKTAMLNLPLFYIETMEEVKNIKSFSYSGIQNNLYFSPQQRFLTLQKYIEHLSNLNLSFVDKKNVVIKIFQNGLASATLGYKFMLENEIICDHYAIKTQKINVFKLILIDLNFCKKFIFNTKNFNLFFRIKICLLVHLKYIFK